MLKGAWKLRWFLLATVVSALALVIAARWAENGRYRYLTVADRWPAMVDTRTGTLLIATTSEEQTGVIKVCFPAASRERGPIRGGGPGVETAVPLSAKPEQERIPTQEETTADPRDPTEQEPYVDFLEWRVRQGEELDEADKFRLWLHKQEEKRAEERAVFEEWKGEHSDEGGAGVEQEQRDVSKTESP